MVGRQMPLANQVNHASPNISDGDRPGHEAGTYHRWRSGEFYNALTAQSQAVIVKPASDTYVRPAAAAGVPAARQAAPSVMPQRPPYPGRSGTTAVGAAPAPRAERIGTTVPRRSTTAWVGIVVVILLCLGGSFLVGAWLIGEEQRSAQATADYEIKETLAARVQTTSTAQAQATSTAHTQQTVSARATATAAVQVTATAQVVATEQSIQAYLQNLETNKVLVFGPSSGNLKHDPQDTHIKAEQADVDIRDFIVEALL
jgi:flagellar basal body-associated protein FliL